MPNLSYRICAVFSFKDQKSKNTFIDWCNGENGLTVTRNWNGCKSLEMFEARENPNKVVIWQDWESKETQESYIKHRHDDGTFDLLTPLMSSPPDINPIKEMVMKTDEEQVKEVIQDMCNKDHKVGMIHMSKECLFIRPTGNPLSMDQWNSMMNNPDVNVESNDLVSINKMEIHGNMAYVVYTTHGKFNYKGTKNDDIAVLTSVLNKVDGKWTVIHGQRSTGRSPSEPLPCFE